MGDGFGELTQESHEGGRRVVTVMFADISGFTALAETCDAELVHDVMNECFAILVPIVERHGGTIDKFIGDCVMALFGAPTAHEDDAGRSLEAALEMMSAFQAFAAQRKLPLDLHFGINTGSVISARIGYGAQRRFSVIGDPVNLAARLEDLSQPGEILVGQPTWDQTEGKFDFEQLGPIALKGKEGPVPVYRLVGRKTLPRPRRAADGPFVGRVRELEKLSELLDAAIRGRGAAVEIAGDAGVGKSRLIDELRSSSTGARWIEVRAQAQSQTVGFGLARQIILAFSGIGRADEAGAVRSKIAQALGFDAADNDVVYLATIAGAPRTAQDKPAFEDLSEAALQLRFAAAFRRLLLAGASREPHVIVCEDLHWADRSSLALVRALAAEGPIPGLLALFTRRPDPDEAGAMRVPGALQMPLETLSASEAQSLLAELLGIEIDNDGLYRLIIERAEGNPYFLEEIARALDEHERPGATPLREALAGPASNRRLPLTVQGIILARMDRLYPAGRQALQTASVIGRSFEVALLTLIADEEQDWRDRLPSILRDLHNRDFTRPNDPRAKSYRFKHGLAQEVAYDSMLQSRRRVLHRMVANVLATRFREMANLAPTLAYHLERAGRPLEAGIQLLRAGSDARLTHANAEALDHFERAVTLLRTVSTPGSHAAEVLRAAHEGAGDVLLLTGRYGEAQAHFEAALALVDAEAITLRGSLLRRCGQARMLERDSRGALSFYDQAVATLEAQRDAGDGRWLAEWLRSNLDMLWPLYWAGAPARMQEIIDKVREPVRLHGTKRQSLRLLDREVLLRLQIEGSAVTDETVSLARSAAQAAEELGGISARTLARQTLGYCLWLNGRASEAGQHHLEALALAQRSGNADQETLALSNLSIISRVMNDPQGCTRYASEMMDVARQIENWVQIGVAHANLAWVALRRSAPDDAFEHAEQALEQWRDRTFRMQWLGWGPLFALAVQRDDADGLARAVAKLLDPQELQVPTAIAAELVRLQDALARADERVFEQADAIVKAGEAVGLT